MAVILITDDEADITSALEIYLRAEGYQTEVARDGQTAVDRVVAGGIDLVLLDVMMPVMDGITALARIREVSNVPVILLTARAEDADKIMGLNVGADDYITKPFNPAELIARVRSQLRRYMTHDSGRLTSKGAPSARVCSKAMAKSYSIMRTAMLESCVLWHSMW